MSYSKQEGPDAREPACMLCCRAEADPNICGDKLEKRGLCAHVFCLFFATLLVRQENNRVGLMGFLPRDIQIAVRRAAQKRCCVCGQSKATIMCCKADCSRWFHLPCAKEGGCVTQYIPDYSTYCPEHRPEQEVEATPEPGTNCLICMEPVEDRKTFRTLVCPACKRAWFHRDCIQGQAMCAGLLSLRCPLCRDIEKFLVQMFIIGIRIPFREPTWEDNDAFADLGERHSSCTARDCLYPGGREEAEEEGSWELLLCSSCAAEGTHRRCSGLTNHIESWECDSCAGLGTASRDESELSGPSLTRQSGLEPAHGSSASEAISPSSSTLVPSGLDPQSLSAEPSSHQHTAWQQSLLSSSPDTSSPSTSRSTYCSSDPEDRVHSRHAGRDCRRTCSRQQGRNADGPIRSRSRCDRSSRTRSRTERPRRQETSSRASPRRSCSHQQGQAQSPPVRSRSRRDRSSRTRSRTERPRRWETSSRASPRHSRSCQQGQAQSPPVRSRSRRDRSSRTRSRTERPRRWETSSRASPRHSRSRQQGQAQSPPVRSRSRRDRSSRTRSRTERPRRRETSSRASPRHSHSRQQGQAQSPPVRSRSRRDRSSRTRSRTERPRRRETSSRASPRHSHSRQQGQAQSPPVRSRCRRDRSSRTRSRTERPR
ncbi:PHD finger protein 7-like [Vidua macroura]|uniref:PHD finger protein 7-like n=1 Tax=Vidua macroura TaxID=187451 RepID=UPI0023A8107C|nr:PHD finger protein 7-like [Vidua macroura]